jgi:hypothetical protein
LIAAPLQSGDPPRATTAEIQRAKELFIGEWRIASLTEDGEQLGSLLVERKLAKGGMLHITEAAVIWPHVTSQTSLNSMLGMRVKLTGGWGCGGCTGPRLLFHNMLARVHVNNVTICQFINKTS